MMRAFVAGAIILSLAACRGERSPPLTGGDGVQVDPVDRRSIAIDPAKVPLVGDCAEGQIVVRTAGGWACTSEADVAQSALDAQLAAIDTLVSEHQEDLTELQQRLALASRDVTALQTVLAMRRSAEEGQAFSFGALACTPSQATTTAGILDLGNARVSFSPGSTGSIVVYCPVIATHARQSWSSWLVRYRDGDGNGASASVTASLRSVDRSGTLATISTLRSGAATEVTDTEASFAHVFDFDARFYYVELELTRSSADTLVELFGFRLQN